jgi:hypothetical protein
MFFIRFLALAFLINTLQLAIAQPTISGTVRNALNNNPVSGADLDIIDENGNFVGITGDVTQVDGTYTISLPDAGSYIIRVDLLNGSPLADQYYNGAFLRSAATPVTVPSIDSQITGIDFLLQPGFSISGRLTGNGISASEIDLDLYSADGEFLGSYPGRTAADGTFSLAALPNGTYYLKADPDPTLNQYFLGQFYGNSQSIATASPIIVNGASITGINWDLPPGGVISGSIQSETGTVLENIDLDVYDTDFNRLPYNARSAVDGTYQIGPMPAGTYIVRADPGIDQGYHLRTYYGNGISKDLAVPVQVSLNQSAGNIDFSLPRGGIISGQITGADGNRPLSGIDIDIYDGVTGSRIDLTAKSGTDGQYRIGALPAGTYELRADPAIMSGYSGAYFGGNSSPPSAQTVTVVALSDTNGVSFQLEPGGWISGSIINASGDPMEGIDLDAFDQNGKRLYPTARSQNDGSYLIGPLPVGGIILRADPTATAGVMHLYYPDAGSLSLAQPISVSASSGSDNKDFVLPLAGWISGTVRSSSGAALADIDLDVFDSSMNRISLSTKTSADGNYLVGPLPVGQIIVRADPHPDGGYARHYYQDTSDQSRATLVTVDAGLGTPAIDFSLPPAGWITGTVRDSSGNPVQGIDLDAFDSQGNRLSPNAVSSADGSFMLGPIPVGLAIVRADPGPMDGYAQRYFPNDTERVSATAVAVEAGSETPSIDFNLPPAGWISGYVRDLNGQPVDAIDLDLFDSVTGDRIRAGSLSAADGSFIIGPLDLGTYKLRADPGPTDGFAVRYYPDARSLADGSIIAVNSAAGVETSFALQPAGYITGTVRNSLNGALADIDLDLFDAATGARLRLGTTSDNLGQYILGPLEYGSYLVRADPNKGDSHVRAYYNDAGWIEEATVVEVINSSGNASIDFSLVDGKSISGQVLLPNGLPAAGIDLDIIDSLTGRMLEQIAITDENGLYSFRPVPFGNYLLKADPLNTSPYEDTYFPSSLQPETATLLQVDAAANTDGLSIQLLEKFYPFISRTDSNDAFVIFDGSGKVVSYAINAAAEDISSLKFYANDVLLATDDSPPYNLEATGLPYGMYSVVPVVVDKDGLQTEGDPLFVVHPRTLPTVSQPLITVIPGTSLELLLAWKSDIGIQYMVKVASQPGAAWSPYAESQAGTGDVLSQSILLEDPGAPAFFQIEGNN